MCDRKETQPHTIYSILYCIFFITYVLFFEKKNFWKFSERPDKKTDDVDIERFGFVELMGELMLKTDDYKNI